MSASDDILLRIGADVSELKRGLQTARKEVTDTGKIMDDLKGKLVGLAAVLGLGGGFVKLVGDALQYADAIQKAADQTGIAAEDIQFLRFAAEQTGTSVEGMTNLVGKMQTQLVEASKGNKEINRTLIDMGLSVEALRGMSPDDQFAAIATEIAKIKDPGEQAAAAVELFGKSGKDALPLIKTFGEGQDELKASFEDMGGPVSASAIKAVDDIGDAASATALGLKLAVTELVAMSAPGITGGLKLVTKLIGALRGEAQPTADSIEGMNKKLTELYAIQAQGAFRDAGMGLTVQKSPEAMAALQKEIDVLKAGIVAKYALLAVNAQEHAMVAEELEDITVLDEARIAALEKERIARENRMIDAQAARQKELQAELEHLDTILNARVDASAKASEIETGHLYDSVDINANAWEAKVEKVTGSLTQMTAGVTRESRAMFEINKAAAMAGAVVNTAQGITQALAAYPPPISFAMAAAQAVAGAAQIAAISKTKFGSGTAPSQATQPATPVSNVGGQGNGGGQGGGSGGVMRVEGVSPDSLFTGRMVRNMADKMNDFVRDGGKVEWVS